MTSFSVKELNVVASISPYVDPEETTFSKYDYMIGFEVDTRKLINFNVDSPSSWAHFASVGKENPFVQEPLTPIVWSDITSQNLSDKYGFLKDFEATNTYLFETDSLKYFLQDQTDRRRLCIVNSQNSDLIIKLYFEKGEGTSLAPLNYTTEYNNRDQWTGKLLKDQPPVVFGFEYQSFGCPYISMIDKSKKRIFLKCDNRH